MNGRARKLRHLSNLPGKRMLGLAVRKHTCDFRFLAMIKARNGMKICEAHSSRDNKQGILITATKSENMKIERLVFGDFISPTNRQYQGPREKSNPVLSLHHWLSVCSTN